MLTDAVYYPSRGDDARRTILVGSVLTLFSFLLLPILPVLGYLQAVLRSTAGGDAEEPPVFEDWETLAVDGVKAFVVGFVYSLVPAVVLAVTAGGAVLTMLSGSEGAQAVGALGLLGGLLVAGVLSLAFAYVLPVALVRVAETGRVGAGFEFGEFTPVLQNGEYATGWLLALVVAVGVSAVGTVLAGVPFLGWLVMAAVSFYGWVAVAYLWGRAYGAARDDLARRSEPTERGATA